MGERTNEHHIEISYGLSAESRYVRVDGQDISKMVARDGVTVQFTETVPTVTLTLIPTWLDITLDGAEVETVDAESED